MGKAFVTVMVALTMIIIAVTLFIDRILPPANIDLLNNLPVKKTVTFDNLDLGTNPGAEINLVEFGDFTCGHCAMLAPDIKKLLELYPGKINFVFKHYPTDQNKDAPRAALAAECARSQGKFMEYHDLLFQGAGMGYEKLKSYATQLQMDLTNFTACMEKFIPLDKIESDIKDGRLNGVRGTPTLFINERMIEGLQPLSMLNILIDQELTRIR